MKSMDDYKGRCIDKVYMHIAHTNVFQIKRDTGAKRILLKFMGRPTPMPTPQPTPNPVKICRTLIAKGL